MDIKLQTAQEVSMNGKPPTDQSEFTDQDLKNLFIKQQIDTWGFDQVETWFEIGFDLIVVNGKVIWVK